MSVDKKVEKVLEITLVILMSVLVLDVLWQVFSRYLLSSPSSFTDELAGYLLVWVGVLGAAYVSGKKEHLAIDILVQRSPAKRQYRLKVLIHVLVFLFTMGVMVIGGISLVYSRFVLDVKSAALQLPLGYVYLVLPISGLLMSWFEIRHIIELRKNK